MKTLAISILTVIAVSLASASTALAVPYENGVYDGEYSPGERLSYVEYQAFVLKVLLRN